MVRNRCFVLFACFLFTVSIAFPYDVVLKSGKIVKGNLLSENDDVIVLQDASGIKMTFKKTLVNLERTAEVNKSPEATLPADTPKKKESPAVPAAKKPARVFTKKDVAKLHESDPGKGLQEKEEEAEMEPGQENEATMETPERTEEEWRASVQQLVDQAKEAEESYNYLQGKCQEFKGADIIVNEKGEYLDRMKTTEETCERAEEAKTNMEQAKKEYRDFQEDARQQMVPPGYVRTDDEYQEKLENETPPQ